MNTPENGTHRIHSWGMIDPDVVHFLEADSARHPRWADLQNLQGLLFLSRGWVREATQVFGRCLELNPEYGWAAVNLSQSLGLGGQQSRAHAVLDQARSPEPGVSDYARAFLALLEGRQEAGRQILDALSPELRERLDFQRLYAALLAKSEPGRARSVWSALQSRVPQVFDVDSAPWDPNGVVDPQLLSFVPGSHQLWVAASNHLGQLGRVADAENAARIAHLLWADRGDHHNQLGLLAALRGDDTGAAKYFQEAIWIAPKNPKPHIALAYHWSAIGELENAHQALTAAIERAPGFADLQYQLGLLETARKHHHEALDAFGRALELNPEYTLCRLEQAMTWIKLERWDEAREGLAQVLESGVASADLYTHLGKVEEARGQLADAETALRRALRLNPGEAYAHYLLGSVYRRRGNRDAAKRAWKTFLELNSDPARAAEVESLMETA